MFSTDAELCQMVINCAVWCSTRGGHTVETLLNEFAEMGLLRAGRTAQRGWTETNIRIRVAEMLRDGVLDMLPNGTLILPTDLPDPVAELYCGDWYVTKNGQIIGPLSAEEVGKLW